MIWSAHVHAAILVFLSSCQIIQQQKASEAENEEETDTLLAFVALGGNVRQLNTAYSQEYFSILVMVPVRMWISVDVCFVSLCVFVCSCACMSRMTRAARCRRRSCAQSARSSLSRWTLTSSSVRLSMLLLSTFRYRSFLCFFVTF